MQSRFAALALWAAVLQCLAGQAATVVVRSNKIVISSQRNVINEEVPLARDDPPDGLQEATPKMGPIEVMRAGLCWSRPTLIDHSKCMGWMVSKCKVKSSGAGFCKKLKSYVTDECKGSHEQACDYAKQLGIDVKPDPEEEKKEEEKKEESWIPDVKEKVKEILGVGKEDKQEKEKEQAEKLEELEKEAAEEERKEIEAEAPAAAPAAAEPAAEAEEAAPAPAPLVTTTVAAAKEATEAPPASAPAPATTEKPRPEKEEKEEKKEQKKEEKKEEEKEKDPKPPTLPSQGFRGKPVRHEDGDTMTADWGKEYGNPEEKEKKKSGAVWAQQNLVVGAIVLLSWRAQMVASGN